MIYIITLLLPVFGFAVGVILAVLIYINKRKREEERLKEVIKQAIEETKKND